MGLEERLKKLECEIHRLIEFRKSVKESLETYKSEYAKRSMKRSLQDLEFQIEFYEKKKKKLQESDEFDHY